MIPSYEEFITTTDAEDARVMNLFAMDQMIEFNNDADADAMFARLERLDTAGYVLNFSRKYERREGVRWQSFEAFIQPTAAAYLARAASERITPPA